MSRHRHRYQVGMWRGGDVPMVGYRCQNADCPDKTFERPMDPEERARFMKKLGYAEPAQDVHHTWHELAALLPDGWQNETTQEGKAAIMKVVEDYATSHPDHVYLSGVDDTYFTSSDLVLVTHEAEGRFMGTTVILVTQCDGQPPAQFFLYPGHADGLMQNLAHIKVREAKQKVPMKGVPDWMEDRAARDDRLWWNRRPVRKKEAIK